MNTNPEAPMDTNGNDFPINQLITRHSSLVTLSKHGSDAFGIGGEVAGELHEILILLRPKLDEALLL